MIYLHVKRKHSVIENYRLFRSVVVYCGRNLNSCQMIRRHKQKTVISPDATMKNLFVAHRIYIASEALTNIEEANEITKLWNL